MPRYLIKVTQSASISGNRIAESVRAIGSHFAAHADWHYAHGMTTGTLIVDVSDHRLALAIVPPNMRSSADVRELASVANDVGPSHRGREPYPAAA